MDRKPGAAAPPATTAVFAAPELAQAHGGGSAPLTIVAQLKAKPGKEQELRQALQALVEPTRREEGLINYDMHVSNDDPGLFLFYENWRSRELWQRHMNSPHLQAFGGRQGELVEDWKLFEMTRLP
jgi:quinol monooxygenase YgiN